MVCGHYGEVVDPEPDQRPLDVGGARRGSADELAPSKPVGSGPPREEEVLGQVSATTFWRGDAPRLRASQDDDTCTMYTGAPAT